jgi:hypothetical protein
VSVSLCVSAPTCVFLSALFSTYEGENPVNLMCAPVYRQGGWVVCVCVTVFVPFSAWYTVGLYLSVCLWYVSPDHLYHHVWTAVHSCWAVLGA